MSLNYFNKNELKLKTINEKALMGNLGCVKLLLLRMKIDANVIYITITYNI